MLYLVPTPIGNLDDITLRALQVLQSVDLILAEDTRTSGFLLKHHNISTPLRAFHMHNEHALVDRMVEELRHRDVALISDAGTPGISDPGYLMVRKAVDEGLPVQCLPGATAFVPALINSALPNHNFCFEGFLPVKKGRKTRLEFLQGESRTMIFYESPYRLLKTLKDFEQYMGAERSVSVSREISKKFEETVRGTVAEVIAHFTAHPPKGEFVLCLAGK